MRRHSLSIGLYGGSFDPPHEGHVHVAQSALKAARLDRVWWMISPGNPLKKAPHFSLNERLRKAQDLITDRRIEVNAIEQDLGTYKSIDTLRELQRFYSYYRFVWIIGADNLSSFHYWHRWQEIAERVPILVIDRKGYTHSALSSSFALRYRRSRIDEGDAGLLSMLKAPRWCFLHAPLKMMSSTIIRKE